MQTLTLNSYIKNRDNNSSILKIHTSFVQLNFLGGRKNFGFTLADRAKPINVCASLICAKCRKSESEMNY